MASWWNASISEGFENGSREPIGVVLPLLRELDDLVRD
jgi:hypothetical protein